MMGFASLSSSYGTSLAASLRLGRDRLTVDELDPVDVPGAARRAATQRLDGQAQLVAGLQRLAGPAVAGKGARAAAFEVPRLGSSILVLDVENDEGVRARIFELLDHPGDFLRVFLVEHREGVMGYRHAGEGKKSSTREHGSEIGLHAFPPFGICTCRRLRHVACGATARKQNTPLG